MPTKQITEQGSIYELSGNYDLSAPNIQKINAPVSGVPIWVPAGLPPVRWESIKIIKRVEPNVFYEDIKKDRPEVALNIESLPDTANESIASQFNIPGVEGIINKVDEKFTIFAVVLGLLAFIFILRASK